MVEGSRSPIRTLIRLVDRVLLNGVVVGVLAIVLIAASAVCFYLAYRDYQRSFQPPEPVLRAAKDWLTRDELLSQWYNARFVPVNPAPVAPLRGMKTHGCADLPKELQKDLEVRLLPASRVLPEARQAFYSDLAGLLHALAQNSFEAYRGWYEKLGFHVGKDSRERIVSRLVTNDIPVDENADGWRLLEKLWSLESPQFAVVAVAPAASCVQFWEGPSVAIGSWMVAQGSQARHAFSGTIPGRHYVEPGVYGHAKPEEAPKLLLADVVLIAKHSGQWNDAVCPYYLRMYYDPLCKHWHPISMELAPAAFRMPRNITFWY